jgi:hypothetical protein
MGKYHLKFFKIFLAFIIMNIFFLISLNADGVNDKVIITNIGTWQHPTKEVFIENGCTVIKVELIKNKTYPIFYVKHDAFHDIYNYPLLKEVALKNGFWDFEIIDSMGFVEVYCDRSRKKLTKSVSDKGITDFTRYNFSKFQGTWYNTSLIGVDDSYNIIELQFDKYGQNAFLSLLSYSKETGKAEIRTKISFDYDGVGYFTYDNDLWGNQGKGSISISVDDNDISLEIDYMKRSNEEKGFFVGMGAYAKENDYLALEKAANILEKKFSWKNCHRGFYIPKTDDDSVYFDYDGKDDQGRYVIAVRRCSDTTIVNWYHFTPKTFEVEVSE